MDSDTTWDALGRIYDTAGKLVAVREHRFEGDAKFVERIDLEFAELRVSVVAEGEFDSIAILLGDSATGSDVTVHEVSHRSPWSTLISRGMRWGWLMRNHQGYEDGIQMEFSEGPDSLSTTIQFMVEASQIKVLQVLPCVCDEGDQ